MLRSRTFCTSLHPFIELLNPSPLHQFPMLFIIKHFGCILPSSSTVGIYSLTNRYNRFSQVFPEGSTSSTKLFARKIRTNGNYLVQSSELLSRIDVHGLAVPAGINSLTVGKKTYRIKREEDNKI